MANRVLASHILVKTKDEADALLEEIKGGASFEDTARAKSLCPSGKQSGGSLGWFGKGQMVQPFEEAAFSMEKGAVSDPVQTQFGWHLIRLDDSE